MVRLTRAQQQELTHERLLEAGRTVFLRKGFMATTVEDVAAEAGYTRGAVYKHFGGKEGLWLALVDATAEAHLHVLGAALERAVTRDELIGALIPTGPLDEDAARWSAAAAEALAAMAQQPATAAAVGEVQLRLDGRLADLLARQCERLGVQPELPLHQAVVMLGALGVGLALRRGAEPTTDVVAVTRGVLALVFPNRPRS